LEEGMIGGINVKNDDIDDFNEKLSLSGPNVKHNDEMKENKINLEDNNIKNDNLELKPLISSSIKQEDNKLNAKIISYNNNEINQNQNIKNDEEKKKYYK
jgi:hypothetical protein